LRRIGVQLVQIMEKTRHWKFRGLVSAFLLLGYVSSVQAQDTFTYGNNTISYYPFTVAVDGQGGGKFVQSSGTQAYATESGSGQSGLPDNSVYLYGGSSTATATVAGLEVSATTRLGYTGVFEGTQSFPLSYATIAADGSASTTSPIMQPSGAVGYSSSFSVAEILGTEHSSLAASPFHETAGFTLSVNIVGPNVDASYSLSATVLDGVYTGPDLTIPCLTTPILKLNPGTAYLETDSLSVYTTVVPGADPNFEQAQYASSLDLKLSARESTFYDAAGNYVGGFQTPAPPPASGWNTTPAPTPEPSSLATMSFAAALFLIRKRKR
jgi:hypothetical protein